MSKRSPQEIMANWGPEWRQLVMGTLSVYEGAPHESPIVKKILDDPGAEKAFKYIVGAVVGNEKKKNNRTVEFSSILDVMARSLTVCSLAYIFNQVSNNISGNQLKYIQVLIGTMEMYSKFGENSVYEAAMGINEEQGIQKTGNAVILNSLYLLRNALYISTAKPKNKVGKPIQFHEHMLVLSLAGVFNSALGRPVHGATAALVNATFCKKSMTEDRVKKILSSDLLRAHLMRR